jgi:hypothetical protein
MRRAEQHRKREGFANECVENANQWPQGVDERPIRSGGCQRADAVVERQI